jgi:hypothetical protein
MVPNAAEATSTSTTAGTKPFGLQLGAVGFAIARFIAIQGETI